MTEVIRSTQMLPDPGYARVLDNKLNQLRRLSDSCLKYADETEKGFDDWLLVVTEFHTASVQKHGTTEADAEASSSARLQAEIEATYKDKEIASAEKAANVMLQSLNKAEAAFQKANDDVPSGILPFSKYLYRDSCANIATSLGDLCNGRNQFYSTSGSLDNRPNPSGYYQWHESNVSRKFGGWSHW